MNVFRKSALSLAILSMALLSATGSFAAKDGTAWDGSEPAPGIYFYWYEPSFYAGFAPRTQDPSRVHIELSRGNQVRFTAVLGPEEIDAYLANLDMRQKTFQELIDKKIIVLSANRNFERFDEKLKEQGVADIVADRGDLGEEVYREKSVEVMSALNPGRVFNIHIPVERLTKDWHGVLAGMTAEDMKSAAQKLDAANALLPGRINLYELTPELEASLAKAVDLAHAGGTDSYDFVKQAKAFLTEATQGHYVVADGHVDAIEFTHIMPAGTVAAWTDTPRGRLPAFGVTGVWPLMVRAQGRGVTGMVDYLSSNPGYGFIPLLAYQHAGGVYYNAFHNAGIRSPVGTHYLPKAWRDVASERNPDKKYKNLWLVSRGPASHGCTRMDSGQMSEMRDALPSSSDVMAGIPTYRNLPQCYEVFDINGDGSPEVMGVQYYVAYKSVKHTPEKALAPNNRKGYYDFLYGSNISYNADGSAVIKEVPVCRFVGKRKAEEAKVLQDVPLYEAEFEPGPIQFYQLKPVSFESAKGFEFNRELRKIGTGHETDRSKLFLD